MKLKSLLPAAIAVLCLLGSSALAAETPDKAYFYFFDLKGGGSCYGSSNLKPDEFAKAVAQASTAGGFVRLDHYRTEGGGEEAPVGFINPHYIVRFCISDPPTPSPQPAPR